VSASEKLKALGERFREDPHGELDTMIDALPQIVEVVEAAETTHADLWKLGASQDWTEYHEGREHLRAALAALEEALQ